MTPPVRERTGPAVHASPTAEVLVRSIGRSVLISAAVGLVLSLVGAFGVGNQPFIPRTLILMATFCAGSILGMSCFALAGMIRPLSRNIWLQAFGGGVLMILPMTGILWLVAGLVYDFNAANRELLQIGVDAGVICIAMTFLSVAINRGAEAMAMTQQADGPPRFLDRLPPKLKGAEIYAVESEDHYLRLHTSKGQDLILMRLADAIAELEGIEGGQVHRSWWVARAAIADAKRADGRATLTLTDGSMVPVSRTYARHLKDAGWL